jgi:hypothetical protein
VRLRQIALAARSLDESVAALTDVLGIEVGFHDPGVGAFGLENAVMPIGDTFLEVVSPVRDDATAQRWIRKRGGDAGYMAIFQCDDYATHESEVERAEGAGAVKVWEGEHEGAVGVHFHPRELGAIVSLDAMPRWGDWIWAGPAWRDHVRTDVTTAITGAEVASGDPGRLAERWADVLGEKPARDAGGRAVIDLPRGGRLVFVPGDTGDAIIGVELAVADRDAFAARAEKRDVLGSDGVATIAGVRFIPASG